MKIISASTHPQEAKALHTHTHTALDAILRKMFEEVI